MNNVSKLIASCNCLEDAKALHGQVVRQGLDRQLFIGTALVRMYGRLGCVEEARRSFEKMPARDAVAWTVMLWVYAQAGHLEECRRTFYKMPRQDVVATNVMIRAYAQHGCMKEAKRLFGNMLEPSVMSWNSMISGYCLSGSLVEAREMFDRMPAKDVVTWTILCRSYAQHGYICEAMKLFEHIPEKNVVSWNSLISAFAETGKLQYCVVLFERMPQRDIVSWSILFWAFYQYFENVENAEKVFNDMPEHNVVVTTAIMEAYARCGHLYRVEEMFSYMPFRSEVSWNVLVLALVQSGELDRAQQTLELMDGQSSHVWNTVLAGRARENQIEKTFYLFRLMDLQGLRADHVTFASVLGVCETISSLELIRTEVTSIGIETNVVVATALIDAYGRVGMVDTARNCFDNIAPKDLFVWTAMLGAYTKVGDISSAVSMFENMPQHSIISWNSLLSTYLNAGYFEKAQVLLDTAPERHVSTWNVLIGSCVKNGRAEDAISAFLEMESRGILPDSVTWIQLCGAGSLLHQSKLVANLITRNCWKHDVMVNTAVIDMHGKCSELEAAEFVFSTMPVCTPVSWNAVIAAYARNGNICKALGFFREMFLDSVPPNEVTFLVLMNSCSHRGLVPEGMKLFYSQELLNSRSMHHSCVADLSARAGRVMLDASEENIGAWTSALAAFIRQGDYMNGVDVIKRIVTLGNAKYALLISNFYALCR
ncbi:pentatricopeptide repeat-containing protein At1g09410, mitochondrial [Selaginella moellendorffii]|uniref:pentatricopeptide repeat-containing protein At1g09410, mitochondrial n=1 Tax=Selaginella moellendorffii TaxID=88036 RepID=UPI000D1C6EFE|nr:pentatricopeptide repeat-containing protein At1g09410, mitochondrial [Selaginella moellendorffii]|eukprot:XP_024530781.1 pentatricopeptide repeat-containing protein At1g09410, mitochondrial [Selaginella moellendorffii]